ncbi:MAG: ketoacyl-ACP synthase III [Planctomycetota bacterium]|jgi:3-oxoacyl-[acyl-carrier-protein] synthase-3|nr:ketoacyl-ACP synthase III [Planctomycetota bacterium]
MSEILTLPRPSRFGRAVGFRLAGIGSHVPPRVVTNADLDHLGCDPQWIVERSGIRERRHAPPEIATSDLAAAAAREAIVMARVDIASIDLLVLGTFTPDMCIPSTACIVQEALGLDAPAMDVTAACAGFAYALVTASQFLAAGTSRRVLVIGADTNSRVVDPADIKTWPLFGDGAGAVLLEAIDSSDRGLLASALGSDGRGAGLLACPMSGSRQPISAEGAARGEQFMQMDGRAVFKWAIRLVEENVRQVVTHSGLPLEAIDLFVLHQANARIIEAARAALGIPEEKMAINLDRFGNTSSGSIPLALDEAWRAGRVGPGSTVVVCGFGGGLAWGSAVWRL